MKIPVLILIIVCFFFNSSAQVKRLSYSEPILLKDLQSFKVIGKWNNEYLTFQKNVLFHKPFIRTYNEQMFRTRRLQLKGFPAYTSLYDFFQQDSLLYITYIYNEGNRQYYAVNAYDQNLQKKGKKIILDFINKDTINSSLNLSWSQDKSKIVVWHIYPHNKQLAIHFKIYDRNFKMIDSSTTAYNFNFQTEALTHFLVSNNGDIYYIFRNKSNFYKGYDIVFTAFKSGDPKPYNISLKNKIFSGDLKPVYDNVSNTFLITSFYKNTGNPDLVNGLFIAAFNKTNGMSKVHLRPFEDNTLTRINNLTKDSIGIPQLNLSTVLIKKNGGLFISSELVSRQLYDKNGQRYPNSGLYNFDQLWKGPARFDGYKTTFNGYSYYDMNNQPELFGGPVNFNKTGSNGYQNNAPKYENCYRDILLFTLDETKERIQSTGISRNLCSQNKIAGFVNFSNSSNIEIFYNNDDSLNSIKSYSVSPDLSLNGKGIFEKEKYSYNIIPSLSKQVSANQAILTLVHNGYLWYKMEAF